MEDSLYKAALYIIYMYNQNKIYRHERKNYQEISGAV